MQTFLKDFGITYKNQLKPGKNKISFLSENTRIAGHLFLPPSYSNDKTFPAIVVVTPASGIKEQTAGIYAKKMAKQGYITLAFDHRTYGESGGTPRGMENAPMKVEDIKNAISFIGTVPSVNKMQIAALGICSGAGYSIQSAIFDQRIKAVATVSGFVDFIDYGLGEATQYLDKLEGNPIEQFQQQIAWGNEARQIYYETGEVLLIDGIPPIGAQMGTFWDRAADYYRNPERGGQFSTYSPMRAAMSLDSRYAFNPSEQMKLMANRPFLAIVGAQALSAYFSEVAVKRAKGDKELVRIPNATHFDLYDQEIYVNQAIEKLNQFYSRVLLLH
ncbi:alpha/beta hydrolase [Aureispira anguillae]|uniref:Alpha/beta hydrolase n=1 Tax=Aureispira anguillae TaxID=2864201 RepID=A0A916DSZ5_9BACT|nr:alpha/beta hydrolase [Aureispira anguillae]BDS11141.1 alpha/beta hydrolase [Aureispira anguillae]